MTPGITDESVIMILSKHTDAFSNAAANINPHTDRITKLEEDIIALEGSGSTLTSENGISITNDVITVDFNHSGFNTDNITESGNLYYTDTRVLNTLNNATSIGVGGTLNITNTTSSNSRTTGALTVTGGVGIQGHMHVLDVTTWGTATIGGFLNAQGSAQILGVASVGASATIGGSLTVSGYTAINSNITSTDSATGALIVIGGVGIGENLNVGGNSTLSTLDVTGNVGLSSSLGVVIYYNTEHQIPKNVTLYGYHVALSRDGKSLAVGSPRDDGARAGAVHVYTRTDLSQGWTQKGSGAVIIGSIADAQQGTSVAISDDGNTVAGVGLLSNENAVKVGRYSGNAWTITSFSLNITQLQFSYPVIHLNASGNIILITFDGDSSNGINNHGSAWVYEYINSTWTQKGQTISGNTSVTSDRLGAQYSSSLSKDGLTFSVGRSKAEDSSKGEITVYDWNGTSWVPKGTPLTGPSNANVKHHALSDDGNTIVCGSRGNFNSVRVFVWSGSQWTQKGADIPNPATFSTYLAISGDGNKLSLGNPFSGNGFINIYEYANNLWTVSKTIQNGSDTFGQIMSFTYDGKNIATSAFTTSPSIVYTYSTVPDYGSTNQVLTSNGNGPPSWNNLASSTPIYAGAGVSKTINGVSETTLNTWSSQVADGITVATTNTFTTPTAGWYSLGFSLECQGVNQTTYFTTAILRIKRNGTTFHALQDNDNPSGGSDLNLSVTFGGSFLIQMTEGQNITFTTEVNSGSYLVTGFASLVKVS